MPPTNTNIQSQQSSLKEVQDVKNQFKFIYKDTEYDCSGYVDKHPGGKEFFEKQAAETNDFTQYFQALHSKKAEKIISSLPKTGKKQKQTPESIFYEELNEKVKHLYPNNYFKDAGFCLFVAISFFVGCYSQNYILGFLGLFINQIVSGWLCHSWAHGRDKYLYKFVDWFSPFFAGVSTNWWNRKHNLHHMFTNVEGKDEDIMHNYFRSLFGFLYLKWNFDSIVFDYKSIRILPLILHFIFMFQQNLLVVFIAMYASGFLSAHVLVGNHEHEKMFQGKHGLDFITHQIITARDYDYHGLFWTTFMGGMQYQVEHHIFPQIPFYNLFELRQILVRELAKKNKEIKVDSILP